MRKLIIKRKRSFVGGMLPYLFVVGIDFSEFEKMSEEEKDSVCFDISNGETMEIEISNEASKIFAIAATANGVALSNEMPIKSGNQEERVEIVTKYSLIKGSKLVLKNS